MSVITSAVTSMQVAERPAALVSALIPVVSSPKKGPGALRRRALSSRLRLAATRRPAPGRSPSAWSGAGFLGAGFCLPLRVAQRAVDLDLGALLQLRALLRALAEGDDVDEERRRLSGAVDRESDVADLAA